jgi:PP-loop superfamily ATP-utilizing enzyme
MKRVLVWFSCGAASAVAAKLAVEKYGDQCEVLYCDTLAYEHPDNPRFMADVSAWIGKEIKLLKSEKYADIFDVFTRTGWLIGVGGARCTTELKKNVRKAYQRPDDLHIFGLTADEQRRIDRFEDENADTDVEWILLDNGVKKNDCYRMLQEAGIDLPMMYKLGYNNNNCIGCVKGQAGYWNKIRVDFPDAFDRMAKLERKLNVAINKTYAGDGKRKRVFLDELDPSAGRNVPMPDIDCGVLCIKPEDNAETISVYDDVFEEKAA